MGNFLMRYCGKLKSIQNKPGKVLSIIVIIPMGYLFFTTNNISFFFTASICLILATANLCYQAGTPGLKLLELLLVVGAISILAGMLLPSLEHRHIPASHISCASNLKQIATSLYMYAEDNNGHFPDKDGDAGFEMLIEQNYLSDLAVYLCPATTDTQSETRQLKSSYIYHGGLTTSSPKKTILAQDRAGNHKGYNNYLYCDFHVKGIKDPHYHDPDKDPIIKRLVGLIGWR